VSLFLSEFSILFRALRQADKRWKEHLSRFQIIEKRAAGQIDSDTESDIEKNGATKIPIKNIFQMSNNLSPAKPKTQAPSPKLKRWSSIDEKRRPLKTGRSLMSSDSSEDEEEKKVSPQSRKNSILNFMKGGSP
jgi:hypothetical protein